MAEIRLTTEIKAPIETCFDVSRDIDIHQKSTAKTNERAVAGKTSGLCELHDEITWEAKHFGINQRLSIKMMEFDRPNMFAEKMLTGAFKSFYHQHLFEEKNGVTIVTDIFKYEAPLGFLGKIAEKLFLTNYMTKFLKERNSMLKEIAEKGFVKDKSELKKLEIVTKAERKKTSSGNSDNWMNLTGGDQSHS
jgi:ligand-binding SRPBCC domain-containing protein